MDEEEDLTAMVAHLRDASLDALNYDEITPTARILLEGMLLLSRVMADPETLSVWLAERGLDLDTLEEYLTVEDTAIPSTAASVGGFVLGMSVAERRAARGGDTVG